MKDIRNSGVYIADNITVKFVFRKRGRMAEIFGQKATQQDFDLLLQQLKEGTAQADEDPMAQGYIGEEIAEVEQRDKISELEFIRIADESGGVMWEDSPGRLTIPEIRHFRSQISRFGDLANVLNKYGYSESEVFNSLVQAKPTRTEIFQNIIKQRNFQLSSLPLNLRNDKHFVIALIQRNDKFYAQLSPQEMLDYDFAIQHVRSRVFENAIIGWRYRESDLFEFIPNTLRFDPHFLNKCAKDIIRAFGKNVIQPNNFEYFWKTQNPSTLRLEPQDPSLMPKELECFQFWVDFYNGDKEKAFEIAVKGDMVSKDTLKAEFLTSKDASRFYRKLPGRHKEDQDLSQVALDHDPKTALYLPEKSPLLLKPTTWSALLASSNKDAYFSQHAKIPEQLFANTALLNEVVSSHPELLDNYRESPKALEQIQAQLTPDNAIIFVSNFVEAFDLLPSIKKNDLGFAKKVVEFNSNSRTADKLFKIHGTPLALHAIESNESNTLYIPEDILTLPEVDKVILENIQLSHEKEMPSWAKHYYQRHPENIATLVLDRPNWLFELLGHYQPEEESKKTIPFHLARNNFQQLVNTPKKMDIYLRTLGTLIKTKDFSIAELEDTLTLYAGAVSPILSRSAQHIAFMAVGGEYKNPHPNYPDSLVTVLLNKYYIVPDGLDGDKAMTHLTIDSAGSLMPLLRSSHHAFLRQGIKRVYTAIKNSPTLVYEAAKVDPRILQAVPEVEWPQLGPKLVELIDGDLKALALLYPLLPENMRQNRDLALRATVANSDNYFYIPKTLLQDEGFMTEICGWAAVPAYDLQKMGPLSQIASIARFPFQFHLVDPQLRQDQKLIQGCLIQNMWLFNELTKEEQAKSWPAFQKQLEQRGFVHKDINSWDDFSHILQTKSVHPKRIRSIDGWKAAYPSLFSTPKKPRAKSKHRVLMMISNEDWNGAFTSVPVIDRLVSLGINNIDYHEVGSESDVKRVIAEAKRKGIAYDDVFIGGHGTQNSLALGGHDRARSSASKIEDEAYIDYSDFDDEDFDFGSIIKSGGQLIDLSCSNGKGADKEDNLANRFASTLHTDQVVVASQVPTNITYIDKNPSGRIHLYWMGNTPYLVTGTKKPK
jgi:hypothetical protein